MDIDLSDDEQPLFKQDSSHGLIGIDQREQSDSEDDFGLSSMADQDQLDDLNIPSHMKNILRMGNYDASLNRSFQDESESDDDSVLGQARRIANRVDIDKLNKELELSKNKFKDFGEKEEEEQLPAKTKAKKTKKPKERKRKRDRKRIGDDNGDISEAAARQRRANRFALEEQSDDSEGEEKQRKRDKKSAGRKTRKKNQGPLVDENGEALVYRTTGLLDDTSSSSEDERKLSKKEEMEMHRENERLRRTAEQKIKPVYNVKTFDDLINRPARKRLETTSRPMTLLPEVKQEREVNDSDSDLEIINDPRKIAASLVSPERARYPVPSWSPVRPVTASMREHNRRMLSRMTNESYQHRIRMEQAAKAKGKYTTATERAKQLLQREKDTIMINQQIDQHFEKSKHQLSQDTNEEDEDYQEDQEEEEEDEETFSGLEDELLVEDLNAQAQSDENQTNDDDNEDDNMAFMAFKRWKNKKIKKSIFEDDEDDEQDIQPKKKATPAHSIANFFRVKQAEAEKVPESDAIQDKPLSRLVRRNDPEEEDVDQQELEAMDVDEISTTKQKNFKTKSIASAKPKEKSEYLEEEAVESEDEFFGAAGSDDEEDENLDEFEKDYLVVEHNDEKVDEEALREAFNKQDQESDSHMIQRLLTDITGGGLRKQKAAAEAGLMLDDIDIYEDMDNDLIAIRQAAAARRRKLLKAKGSDRLETLLNDPKTAAFAKAAQVVSDEVVGGFLDEEETAASAEEDQEEPDKPKEVVSLKSYTKRVIVAEEDDEEDNDIDMEASDDDNVLVVEEYDNPMIMASPMRLGGLAVTEEEDGFQIETMKSPLDIKKAKSIFSSPSNTERFRRLIAETSSALNGSGSDSTGVRIGFGSMQREGNNTINDRLNKQTKPMGSIGELFMSDSTAKEERAKKSKLKNLKKNNLFE
ncbi:MRC1-like domain-containing protein [Choanephora cucurbitarum]|nr:MRC1-like domain-containing protein [Choanephora cucurbitarum]